ncbi:acyltransferase family protein [Brachybacterium sp. p3-SID957]|uniref:acyltransferase family protein n=1 Tax=Brachybacterium sp. p3-SID957 TaxID=2916049 RepID=UPI00223ACBFF|nr:acyltransferase family protein [Brachybacterium sp. p3-SID957]MCT1775960.1 acyltransferase [Brachybacterium sp. p3-SID957]
MGAGERKEITISSPGDQPTPHARRAEPTGEDPWVQPAVGTDSSPERSAPSAGATAARSVAPSRLEDWTQGPAPASSLDDWLQGPLEDHMEQSAEDAWSTAESVTGHPDRQHRGAAIEQGTAAPLGTALAHGAAQGAAQGAEATSAAPAGHRGGTGARKTHPERPVFRRELHGLRALALMLVAVYHIWLGRVSGGVDVFLFLSAFFLTGTFVRRLDAGRPLAVPRYWLHTFKRLLPPAAVTILATLAATWWLLPPSIWPTVMQQSAASIGYVQNVLLVFQEVDYQARDAGASSPLQHFWSLSVQGQAFLLWPLLFLLAVPLARRGKAVRRPLLGLMALIVAASLTWSIIETASNQPVAYFDTGARLWEFAAGSMLALALPWIDRHTGARRPEDETAPRFGTQRAMLGWAGLIALLACGVLVDVSDQFPGWIAIWPLTGAAAVVIAGHTGTRWGVDRLLSTRPAAFIGDISYALYLVHWPLLVLWLHASQQERAGLLDGLVVLAGSILLAWVLTRAVDAPVRRSRRLEARPWRALAVVATSVALVVGAAGGWWLTLTGSEPERPTVSANPEVATDEVATVSSHSIRPYGWQLGSQWPDLPERCDGPWAPEKQFRHVHCQQLLPADSTAQETIVVVGSSHARQFIPALVPWAEQSGAQIVNLTMDGCEFLLGTERTPYCTGYDEYALSYIDAVRPSMVLTTVTRTQADSAEEVMPAGTDTGVQMLLDRGIDVIAVRDTPRWGSDRYECAERVITGGSSPADADLACGAEVEQRLAITNPAASLAGLSARGPSDAPPADAGEVTLVDLTAQVCPDGRCAPVLGDTYVYLDDNHLTRLFVESALEPVLRNELDSTED